MTMILQKNCMLNLFLYDMVRCEKCCELLSCNIHIKIEFLEIVYIALGVANFWMATFIEKSGFQKLS